MKRSMLLLIAAAVSTVFFIIAIIQYASAASAAASSDLSAIGASIGMMFMRPYVVVFGFGVAFGWLGWFSLRREPVMIAIALYVVALALSFGYFWLLVLPFLLTVLAFIVQWYFVQGGSRPLGR